MDALFGVDSVTLIGTRWGRGQGRDPEKLRANRRRSYDRHGRVAPGKDKRSGSAFRDLIKRRADSMWLPGGAFRIKADRRIVERSLRRDLQLLRRVITSIRNKLEFPEKNRQKALAYYHAKRKGKPRYDDRKKSLEKAFRRAIKSKPIRAEVDWRVHERKRLERAARNSFKRHAHRKLIKRLRGRLEAAMKYTTNKSQKARELVGCSISELRAHIEKQFKSGMTWENHSYTGWHIDHIKPLAKFDLRDPAQQKIAFHFSNLQPLWAPENLAKHTDWPLQ